MNNNNSFNIKFTLNALWKHSMCAIVNYLLHLSVLCVSFKQYLETLNNQKANLVNLDSN